ncbi:MAG: hypothetical protein IKK43_06220 [Clostridia bacterium]|nr:hypothetical protein [Clostridia bacterium]
MQIFMRILKELGIALLFLLLILGALAFAFYDKVPFGKKVPDSVKYTRINKDDYNVRGNVEDQASATQTFETSSSQLESYLTEKIVSPGRFDPFNPIESVSDIPTETVIGSLSGGFYVSITTDENGNTVTTTVAPDGTKDTIITKPDGTVVEPSVAKTNETAGESSLE